MIFLTQFLRQYLCKEFSQPVLFNATMEITTGLLGIRVLSEGTANPVVCWTVSGRTCSPVLMLLLFTFILVHNVIQRSKCCVKLLVWRW